MSVGLARLLKHFFKFLFSCRYLQGNDLTGTVPPQISTLTKLIWLYAPCLDQFTECWSYVLLSCGLARLAVQLAGSHQADWRDPQGAERPYKSGIAVRHHPFLHVSLMPLSFSCISPLLVVLLGPAPCCNAAGFRTTS